MSTFGWLENDEERHSVYLYFIFLKARVTLKQMREARQHRKIVNGAIYVRAHISVTSIPGDVLKLFVVLFLFSFLLCKAKNKNVLSKKNKTHTLSALVIVVLT